MGKSTFLNVLVVFYGSKNKHNYRVQGLPICRLKCLDRVRERQPVLWAAFLTLAGPLDICGMSFTGAPTHSVLSTASLRWFGMEGLTPPYLREQCCPTGTIERRISLRSSAQAVLLVPRTAYTDCYPTAPRLLCGWADGVEWSPGCAASDASGPLCSIPLWPHCLTEVGQGALLSRLP